MKYVVAIALLVTAGSAYADPPAASPAVAASPGAATQNSTAEDGGDHSSAKPASAPAATAENPAAAAAKPAPAAPRERLQEQLLRSQGYKLTMVNGNEMYCRREAPLGSRLGSTVHCVTVQEAELMAKEGREAAERIQRTGPGCLNKAMGACGQ